MGLFRLLLASVVLASHAGVAPIFSGVMIVQAFFVISGFYIQMILQDQYMGQRHWRLRFYESRLLRIFIPYWFTLFAILAIAWLQHRFFGTQTLPIYDHPTGRMILANAFIVGTESIKLFRAVDGCASESYLQIVVPQVWSVGIELMFYALAPLLLLCRTRALIVISLACIIAKFILFEGHANDIFGRFGCMDGLLNGIFPLETGTFLAGAIGYRLIAPSLGRNTKSYEYWIWSGVAGAATLIGMQGLRAEPSYTIWYYHFYILAVILLVPLLYRASRELKWDRRVGNLSYSFYLWHYFIMKEWERLLSLRLNIFLLAEMTTLVAAGLTVYMIEAPLDHFRHRHFRKSGASEDSPKTPS